MQLAKEDLGEDYFSNKTVFAPSDRALRDMPDEVIEGYKTDRSGLKGWTDSSLDSNFVNFGLKSLPKCGKLDN